MPASNPVISAAASSPNLTWSLMMLQKRYTPRIGPRGCGLESTAASQATAQPASGRLLVLLVIVDFGELRVDDVLVLAAGTLAAGSAAGTGTARAVQIGRAHV